MDIFNKKLLTFGLTSAILSYGRIFISQLECSALRKECENSMGLFGKSITEIFTDAAKRTLDNPDLGRYIAGPICGPVTINSDDIKKVKTIFSDVETDGRKQGYARAASEYEDAFRRVEREYEKTKDVLTQQMAEKEATATKLIAQLQQLERKRKQLKERLDEKTEQVADQYDLPYSTVAGAVSGAGVIMSRPGFSLIDLLYHYKNRRLQEYEEEGYQEARKIYRRKIRELTDNLEQLKQKAAKEIQEEMSLIQDALMEVSELEAKIAEMEIALQTG